MPLLVSYTVHSRTLDELLLQVKCRWSPGYKGATFEGLSDNSPIIISNSVTYIKHCTMIKLYSTIRLEYQQEDLWL